MVVARVQSNRPKVVDDYDDLRELEAALAIDPHALDEALVAQPEAFYQVSKAYALEISRRDAAKQALADAEATADLAVREEAREDEVRAARQTTKGSDKAVTSKIKLTEGEVRAKIQLDPVVLQARERFSNLSETAGKLAALKEAFGQRSYALKDLVGLFLANYYTASEHTSSGNALRGQAADTNRARMNDARRGR